MVDEAGAAIGNSFVLLNTWLVHNNIKPKTYNSAFNEIYRDINIVFLSTRFDWFMSLFKHPNSTIMHRILWYHGVCSEPELDPFNESAAPELQYTEFSTQYLVSTKHFLNQYTEFSTQYLVSTKHFLNLIYLVANQCISIFGEHQTFPKPDISGGPLMYINIWWAPKIS